jgi:hypothetical protein
MLVSTIFYSGTGVSTIFYSGTGVSTIFYSGTGVSTILYSGTGVSTILYADTVQGSAPSLYSTQVQEVSTIPVLRYRGQHNSLLRYRGQHHPSTLLRYKRSAPSLY